MNKFKIVLTIFWFQYEILMKHFVLHFRGLAIKHGNL